MFIYNNLMFNNSAASGACPKFLSAVSAPVELFGDEAAFNLFNYAKQLNKPQSTFSKG